MKHTILGAGSPADKALAHELLKENHNEVHLVSRCEFWIPGIKTHIADLTSYEEMIKYISGSDIVYLCAGGLPYSKYLQESWLMILKSTITSCRRTKARFIYIDNSDIYGKHSGRLTEQTPYRPCSKTGKVLLDAVLLIEREMQLDDFNCIIARSADLYGPFTNGNNYLNSNVIGRLLKGESARWLIDQNVNHSFTHSYDLVKGVLLLTGNDACYNQLWHLPTSPPLSGETFIHMTSNILNFYPGYTVTSRGMIWLSGLLNKSLTNHIDFIDKYESGVSFYSGKFNAFFNYTPVAYYIGIQETIEYLIQRGYPSKAVISSQKEFC